MPQQVMLEMTQEQRLLLAQMAKQFPGEELTEKLREAVGDVAHKVLREESEDPENPKFQQMVRVDRNDIPDSAWQALQGMKPYGVATKGAKENEMKAMAEALKMVLEALLKMLTKALGGEAPERHQQQPENAKQLTRDEVLTR